MSPEWPPPLNPINKIPDMESRVNDAFDSFFQHATGHTPYPFQRNLAISEDFPEVIKIPTGMGKTDAVILGWLWRRRFDPRYEIRLHTPRRLVYCLPMRVLVEQTRDKTKQWLERLGILAASPGDDSTVAGFAEGNTGDGRRIAVTVLMGGEEREWWDIYPERDTIIIGTQDMLISRALNRGYGMNRYRWPTHFGLLNNDCLWVMDEVQLMGRGLATTTQLQAFRHRLGTMGSLPARSVWMSATLEERWLSTVDFDPGTNITQTLTLGQGDRDEPLIQSRIHARKILEQVKIGAEDLKGLAGEILDKHQRGARTLVIVNTVRRASDLHKAISKREPDAKLILIHSRFRPPDRQGVVRELLEEPGPEGTIIISTQVVEAGVDVSAKVLFTELAPWPSLVQRLGRCNRAGEYDDARVYWIDVPTDKKYTALPYTPEELDRSREVLLGLEGQSVGPEHLPDLKQKIIHEQVVREKDVIELFDTTPDLAGNDLDISRFIREADDTDVQVFWRNLPEEGPGGENPEPRPHRDEICAVPIGEIRDLVRKGEDAWIWDTLDGQWIRARTDSIYSGITLMLRAKSGHYTPAGGWDIRSKKAVPVIQREDDSVDVDYSSNESAISDWMSIAEHTDQVCGVMTTILDALGLEDRWRTSLLEGARWHDAGKAHRSFQALLKKEALEEFDDPPAAKAPQNAWKGRLPIRPEEEEGRRKHFRHELASGIAALQNGRDDLVAYLAAAHHGKVRLSIRSMPDERRPPDQNVRFARGIWDGDVISETDLGGGVTLPQTTIDLSFMDLGHGANGASWLARTLELRDRPDIG
ncbi:MAG: CRISPR-associated helicase Cas3', partial [Bacteroidales bacterium]|nr:CRISPR-associated helicase Cas3' [Bacteroidales bacterium]